MTELLIGNSLNDTLADFPGNYAYRATKTALATGTVNELKVYCHTTDSCPVDVAIYDSSGNLLAAATDTLEGSTGFVGISVSDVSVIEDTDYILFAAFAYIGKSKLSTGGTDYDLDYNNAYVVVTTSPPDPITDISWSSSSRTDVGIQAWGNLEDGGELGLFFGRTGLP